MSTAAAQATPQEVDEARSAIERSHSLQVRDLETYKVSTSIPQARYIPPKKERGEKRSPATTRPARARPRHVSIGGAEDIHYHSTHTSATARAVSREASESEDEHQPQGSPSSTSEPGDLP